MKLEDVTGKEMAPDGELLKAWCDAVKGALGVDLVIITTAKRGKDGTEYDTGISCESGVMNSFDVCSTAGASADALYRMLSDDKLSIAVQSPDGTIPFGVTVGRAVIQRKL